MWYIILIITTAVVAYIFREKIFVKLFLYKYSAARNDTTIDKGIATIEFYRSGIKQVIRVPFKSSHRFRSDKMLLIKEGSEIDITHIPGIPYFLTADEMGGEYIIRKTIDDEYRFGKYEVPQL